MKLKVLVIIRGLNKKQFEGAKNMFMDMPDGYHQSAPKDSEMTVEIIEEDDKNEN